MKDRFKKIYIIIQTVVFTILAVSSIWLSICRRYDALKKRLDYRKIFGLVFVASVLEGFETFFVLRWLNRKKKGNA